MSSTTTAADVEAHGGPNTAQVVALLATIAGLRADQVERLKTAIEDNLDTSTAACNAGWRSACVIGGARKLAWYLARRASEHTAQQHGLDAPIPYHLGYIAAGVAHRDHLTVDQFTGITKPWQTTIGPL